jgi:hypothetical protein
MNPISGPIPLEEFKALVDAPCGAARKAIQKHDPFWGREAHEKVLFTVKAKAKCIGTAMIEASSQEDADKLAADLTDASFDWESSSGRFEILSVEPSKSR